MTTLVNDPQIRFEVAADPGRLRLLLRSIRRCITRSNRSAAKFFPGAAMMPFMSTGATDSSQLRLHNVQA